MLSGNKKIVQSAGIALAGVALIVLFILYIRSENEAGELRGKVSSLMDKINAPSRFLKSAENYLADGKFDQTIVKLNEIIINHSGSDEYGKAVQLKKETQSKIEQLKKAEESKKKMEESKKKTEELKEELEKDLRYSRDGFFNYLETLTTLQKEKFIKSIKDKYVTWEGRVEDVENDSIKIVHMSMNGEESLITIKFSNEDELLKINKGSIVHFKGESISFDQFKNENSLFESYIPDLENPLDKFKTNGRIKGSTAPKINLKKSNKYKYTLDIRAVEVNGKRLDKIKIKEPSVKEPSVYELLKNIEDIK